MFTDIVIIAGNQSWGLCPMPTMLANIWSFYDAKSRTIMFNGMPFEPIMPRHIDGTLNWCKYIDLFKPCVLLSEDHVIYRNVKGTIDVYHRTSNTLVKRDYTINPDYEMWLVNNGIKFRYGNNCYTKTSASWYDGEKSTYFLLLGFTQITISVLDHPLYKSMVGVLLPRDNNVTAYWFYCKLNTSAAYNEMLNMRQYGEYTTMNQLKLKNFILVNCCSAYQMKNSH